MRARLVAEGYEQPFGTSDDEIRRNLNLRGKCADFVGRHPERGWWIIAESKGSNFWSADIQLANTLTGLLAQEPDAYSKIELYIYTNSAQFRRLLEGSGGVGGYYRQGNSLGFKPDGVTFQPAQIMGYPVQIMKEGKE
jgi:hypothetical protein